MAANTNPIYLLTPDVQWISMINISANTATDGTGTVSTTWTADATNGGFLHFITVKGVTNTGANNVANVARFFINNGSTNNTATNNSFFAELTLPATTGVAAAALPDLSLPVNRAFPAGYKVNIALGTTTGAALGWYFTGWGGKY
jgi:hypothetical protein